MVTRQLQSLLIWFASIPFAVIARASHARGRGFKSRRLRHFLHRSHANVQIHDCFAFEEGGFVPIFFSFCFIGSSS